MPHFICLLAVILLFGCNGSQKERSTQNAEKSIKETGKAYGIHGPRPRRPKVTPKDWPMTFEQFNFLMSGSLQTLVRRAVNPEELKKAGFQSPKDLVAFAWDMLDADLTPFKRDQGFPPGYIHQACFMMIGLHGDLEDAERLYHRLKSLVQKPIFEEAADESIANCALAQSMGLFLMRDHFMPQEDRSLMEEIEDYLLGCTKYGTPSCWPCADLDSGDDDMRRYALRALAMSCGEKGKARIQEYADDPQYEFSHIIADVCFELRDKVLIYGKEIPKMLSPVLPKEH